MEQTYENLKQNVDTARAELDMAEQKITANQDTLDLFSDKPVAILNCKNVFSKVKAGATIEDGPFTVNCECFNEHEDCANRKCLHYPDNLIYMDACSKLSRVKAAFKDFQKSHQAEIVKE